MRSNGSAARIAIGHLVPFTTSILAALTLLTPVGPAGAADAPRTGLTDLGQADPHWRGYHAPAGFRLEVVADAALVKNPTLMAVDDSGSLYVVETSPASHAFDFWDVVTRPDGSQLRLRKRRQSTLDQIKRLTDTNHDGKFDASEVVAEGVERPTALLWTKHALYVASLGRLESWKDDDGDGRFESRAVLLDGLGAADDRGLSGLTLGADGYLYLTTGDNENHPFPPQGATLPLGRTGGVLRCRLDGSDLRLFASGFRQPRGNLAFDADWHPILIDDDGADGSKLAGVRLIQPSEAGDYGWRTLAGSAAPDHEVSAVDGERPGRLGPIARLSGPAPASLVVYNGSHFPEVCRGLVLTADPTRHAIRGFKLGEAKGSPTLVGETTLVVADDPRFVPEQVVIGADSALYILDRHDQAPTIAEGSPPPATPAGRILRLVWQAGPAASTAAGERFAALATDQLVTQGLAHPDLVIASQALRELVDRGVVSQPVLLAWAGNTALPSQVRCLAVQGARQFWSEDVEKGMTHLLADPRPEVRRLAAQALAWEPKLAIPRLVPKLLERLEDPDGRVIRAVVLAIGRHGETNPSAAAPNLVRWLYAHPQADPITRDAFIRAIERLGDGGIAEVALAVRTRRGIEREQAVQFYAALRSPHAAEELASLIKTPDLSVAERTTLIRQYADFPAEPPVATSSMVEWILKHSEVDSTVKLAALETCRLVGNPASKLILALLDDDAESVRIAAMILASRTRPPGAMLKVREIVNDETRSDLERLAAVKSLRGGDPALFGVLDSAYLGSENAEIRRAALRSMADVDRPKALAALNSALAGPDPALRAEAISLLAATPPGALDVGQAYLDSTLNRADLPAVLRALEPNPSQEVRQVVAAVKRDATQGASALSPSAIRARMAESSSPWAGMEVFFRMGSRCASCHQVGGKGGRSGPPLDLEAHGLTAEKLVEAIQHPARAIKPGFEPPRIAMAVDRSPTRAGPLAGVDRKQQEGGSPRKSTMPEGLELTWTPQEFTDLVAFLLDAPAQAVVKQGGFIAIDQWAAAGPFAPGVDSLRVPLDRFEANRALAGLNGRSLSWLTLNAAPATGRIDLGGLFALQPSRAYAAAAIQSPAPQTAWLHVSTRGSARVYVNGVKVADRIDESMTDDAATVTGVVRITLKSGENLVMVAFDPPSIGEPLASFHLATPRPVEVHNPRN